jgi:hypothetical protein
MTNQRVLISGAGIAGPALAFWLGRTDFDVTVVERAPALREGGQAVDFRGPVHREVLERELSNIGVRQVNDWFFDKPTHAQFFVQETDGLGVSAGWKEVNVTCSGALADPASQPPSDEPKPPFQFGLRRLFTWMTALAVVAAGMALLPGLTLMAIFLLAPPLAAIYLPFRGQRRGPLSDLAAISFVMLVIVAAVIAFCTACFAGATVGEETFRWLYGAGDSLGWALGSGLALGTGAAVFVTITLIRVSRKRED